MIIRMIGNEFVDMEGGYGGRVLGLQDTRDRVVDMIVDVERKGKRVAVYMF